MIETDIILGILYFLVLTLAIIFAIYVMGKPEISFKPVSSTRKLPSILSNTKTTRSLFRNPSYTWATLPYNTPAGEKRIPFPVFRWWIVYKNSINKGFTLKLGEELFEEYGEELKGSYIYAASTFALDFLYVNKKKLKEYDIRIDIYNPFSPPKKPPKDRKIILFDISVSTGVSIAAARQRLPKQQKIAFALSLFINDFVPPTKYNENTQDFQIKYLYKTSDFIKYDRSNPEITSALITMRDALSGEQDWDDEVTEKALSVLENALASYHD